MVKKRKSHGTLFGLAVAGLLLTTAIAPARAEQGPDSARRVVAELDVDLVLGPPESRGQLRSEFGGFDALQPPAASTAGPQTSAIILWDDCCGGGRGTRNRAAAQGTIKATSYR